MAINKKLIFWKSSTFNPPTTSTDVTKDVLWNSIVFFSDTAGGNAGKMWTHGLYYDCIPALTQQLTGFAVGSNAAITSSDTILSAFGKTQAQLNNKLSLSGGTLSGSLYFKGGVYNIDATGTGPTGYIYFRNATSSPTFRVYPETGNLYFSGSLTGGTVPWDRLGGVPSTFTPSAHTHDDRYYTETEIGNLFAGTTAISGYNKSNWDGVYTAFNAMQVGGRNLLKNLFAIGSNFTLIPNGVQLNGGATGDCWFWIFPAHSYERYVNKQLTLSFWVSGLTTGSQTFAWRNLSSVEYNITIQNGFNKLTFVDAALPISGKILFDNKGYISQPEPIQLTRFKLEIGNVATDWTPAPEDVDASIAAVQTDLTTHAGLTNNPHAVTASQVGLGNVENTKLSTWAGSGNITALGTVTSGTWNANTIAVAKGGTGKTSVAANSMLYATAANAYGEVATTAFGRGLLSAASGTMVTGLNADTLDSLHATAFSQEFHYGTTAQNSGYYKININSTVNWMLNFTIRLYQDYGHTDIAVSGYQYGSHYWHSPKATLITSTGDSVIVRFGYDSVNNLWVAVPAGQYTGLTICNINNGYYQVSDWSGKFTVTNQATLTGTTQTTITAKRPLIYDENAVTATTAANLKSNNTTGLMQIVGPTAGTTRVMTTPDSNFTVLYSGGALGTPSSGNLANCTFPTLNQNTSGTAAKVTINSGFTGTYPITVNADGVLYTKSGITINGTSSEISASSFAGSGANLTSLNGSNISSGTVADARIASALTSKTYNGLTISSTTGTLSVTNAKTLSVTNTITLSASGDSKTLNIANGGTLGSAAFTSASAYTPQSTTSATLPATVGWYRIATSASGIARCSARFEIDWAVSGYHGQIISNVGIMYGQDPTINLLHYSHFSTSLTKIRVVYHTTYSRNYAYLEVYNSVAAALVLTTQLISPMGWTLITPVAGSIPAGYSSQELSFVDGIATEGVISSSIATGTAPFIVASTTPVANLSIGGNAATASKVNNSLAIKFDTGTTEGTNLYTFDGAASKTIDIKAGSNVSISKAAGIITISSTDTNTVYTHPTTSGNKHIPSGGESGQILRWSTDGTATWGSDNNTTYNAATSSTLGLSKLFSDTVQSVDANTVTTTASRTYGVQVNSSGQMVVNVPWVDTNTTYSAANDTVAGLVKIFTETFQSTGPASASTTANRTYVVQKLTDANGLLVVNVPWVDTNTTYSLATTSTLGLVKLGSDTQQTVAAAAVTATASRSYAVQVNSSGQMVVNVPWVDTNTTYSNFVGGTSSVTGTAGLVPAPTTANYTYFLKGTGAWTQVNYSDLAGTVPTWNQSTTGSAGSVKSSATTGLVQITGPSAGQTRTYTVPDSNVTLLYSGGALGTPSSGTLTNCTFPTLNQNTTGYASSVKSNSTTGVLQVSGPTAGTTRVMTTPNANFSVADLGSTQTFSGAKTFSEETKYNKGLQVYQSTGTGVGISLSSYGTGASAPTYGLMFAQQSLLGTHGAVTGGNWATYFSMSADAGRGWIFTTNPATTTGNVASISNTGVFTGTDFKVGTSSVWHSGNLSPVTTGSSQVISGSKTFSSAGLFKGGLSVNQTDGSGIGISLYSTGARNPTHGLMLATTANKGTHGAVTGNWATYFSTDASTGRGWIFTTNPAGTTGNVASISNTGKFYCSEVVSSGDVTAYSDISFKKNIVTITDAVNKVQQLRGVYYERKDYESGKKIGVIAQEIEKILPEVVNIDNAGVRSVAYGNIVGLLIEAIKEQQEEINNLKSTVYGDKHTFNR